MPCDHKFKKDLYLKRLDFEPTTLIVGTFNPLIEGNQAEWFYGRNNNNFWEVLPKLYGENSMRFAAPSEWKTFCKRHRIFITDLISCIEDAYLDNKEHFKKLKSYSDGSIAKLFKEHEFVDIAQLLKSNPKIKNVYLTRGTGDKFWKKLWEPIEQYTKENGINEHKLITPSRNARFQNKKDPLNPMSLEDFILMKWKEKWHEL